MPSPHRWARCRWPWTSCGNWRPRGEGPEVELHVPGRSRSAGLDPGAHAHGAARRDQAARALDRWRDGRHLFLVSSDLTHYGADYGYVPFTDDIPARLEKLDTGALLRFLAHDGPGLLAYGEESGITMCGLDAAALALAGPAPADHQSAMICDPAYVGLASDPKPETEDASSTLTDADRRLLLRLARAAAAAAVVNDTPPAPEVVAAEAGMTVSPRLRQARGAFVTLTLKGHLRGCIGVIEPAKPLVDAVMDNGAAAAVSDPRFPPLREEELAQVEVEVSALTPLRPVTGPEAIELGRHGILLSRGRRRAVFLPQVAPEQGWDLPTTLDHLAVKAGLPADAWREGCSFEVFEAEICSE